MGTGTMAKPRKAPKPKTAPGRLAVAFTLKGSPEWKAWVEELANHSRTDVSKLIDLALVEYAKARGIRDAPKR